MSLTTPKRGLNSSGNLRRSKGKVETRDAEIDRLTGLLEGGRPYDVVALEARNRSNERLISHLNIQIDYLQSKNDDLQRQADGALTKARAIAGETANLDSRNAELQQELSDVDRLAKSLELDKDTALTAADREVSGAKIELQKARRELDRIELDLAGSKTDNEQLLSEVGELKAQLTSELADRQRLDDLLVKTQEDKKKLSQRITRLNNAEKDMVIEIDRLKHRNGYKGKGKSQNLIDSFIKGLQEERDYWKGEVGVLQQMLKTSRTRSPMRSPVRSPARSRSPSPSRRPRSLQVTPSKPSSRSSSPSRAIKMPSQFEAMVRMLEDERDHYKRECDIIKSVRSRPASPSRLSKDQLLNGDASDLLQVRRERDELQNLLNKFERHMAEIQTNVKVLTGERDRLSAMHDDARSELARLRRDVVRSPKSPKTSLAAQAVLRRVENERDDVIVELRRMTTERDSLRERLKIATESALADRARTEQQIEDVETALRAAEHERNTLEDQVLALQGLCDSLEVQVKDQHLQLADYREDASAQTSTATQMRMLAEQSERSLGDTHSRLTRTGSELRSAEDNILRLSDQLGDLSVLQQKDREEISRLKLTISALDREKDALQATVDEKAERIALLNDELSNREQHGSELRTTISDMELHMDRAQDSMSSKEREISNLRRQLDSVSEELMETGRGREVALRENRRLQDDLATMTRENQALNKELQAAADGGDQLKDQVQDYIMDVKRFEELLTAKDQERSDLLEQYRTLTLDAEKYETHNHQLESEISNLRLEISTRDAEIRRLREKCDLFNREVDEHLHTEKSYDMQVSQLTRSIANLEENLRFVEDEKHNLLQDLAAVRDLCARLEGTKDSLQRQITTKSLDHEKLATLLDDMKVETDVLRTQVSSERSTVNNLEGLLQSNREKEFQLQLVTQERDSEVHVLKDRLNLNDSKIGSQNREITTTRTHNIELESEVERLRRQVTSERFERERCVQELRRNGLVPPGEGRLSRIGATSPISPTLSRSRSPTRARSPYRRDDI